MKKNKFISPWKIRPIYLAIFLVPGIITMCHNNSREKLDEKISELDKKIATAHDFSTADVPQKLKPTQNRYTRAKNSLASNFDTVEFCVAQNDSLTATAFNNYATRVGREFQLSAILSPHDIATFQKHITALDSTGFIMGAARGRVLQNRGSLHDLSYFFEMFDFDSINPELENKLAWNFYRDTVNTTDSVEMAVLNFENDSLNNLLRSESDLLNLAWREHVRDSVNASDSTTHDSIDVAKTGPNFLIPEFDSVRAQYLHNDSIIQSYKNTMDTVVRAEDSLHEYMQSVRRQRDSLVQKRYEIEM